MAKRKAKEPPVIRQYTVLMQVTYMSHVLVEAASEEQAVVLADRGDWLEDGIEGAELIGYEVRGPARDAS